MAVKQEVVEVSLIRVVSDVDLLRASRVDNIQPLSEVGVKSGDVDSSGRNASGRWPPPIILLHMIAR